MNIFSNDAVYHQIMNVMNNSHAMLICERKESFPHDISLFASLDMVASSIQEHLQIVFVPATTIVHKVAFPHTDNTERRFYDSPQ